jgi:hypothetical protein
MKLAPSSRYGRPWPASHWPLDPASSTVAKA